MAQRPPRDDSGSVPGRFDAGGCASLTSGVAALTESSAVTQQSVAAVASALATLDAETKQKLAALDARLQEVIRLLITPPGHRPGFPN